MSDDMKKAYICPVQAMIILLILVCNPAFSQKGIQYGFSVGIQNTLLRSKNNTEVDVKNAFCPLVTADIAYGISNYFGIQSGIGYALYSQNTSQFRNNFNYLSVPLYLKIGGFRNNRRFALSVIGGANFKFLLSANNVYHNEKKDISNYTTRYHRDYTLGMGIKYKINNNLILESHLTGSFLGGSFNKASLEGFFLRNFNYGLVIGFKYHIGQK